MLFDAVHVGRTRRSGAGFSRQRSTSRSESTVPRVLRLAAMALCAAVPAVSACDSAQPVPHDYACDPTKSGQSSCVASVTFASGVEQQPPGTFAPLITGYRTDVSVVSSMSAGDGRIGNAMRLTGSSSNLSFVEVGYMAIPGVALNCNANGGGLWYYVSILDAGVVTTQCVQRVPTVDRGTYARLEIASLGPDPTQPSSFRVTITTPNTNIDLCRSIPCVNRLWTAGAGRFATVELVQTLIGTAGAMAGAAIYKNNSYQRPNGNFSFQVANGRFFEDAPPYFRLIQSPADGATNNNTVSTTSGGTFLAQCCTAP
jgi:hypothetical protein